MCLKECIKEHVALISLIRIPYPMLMIKLFNFDKSHGITINLHNISFPLISFLVLMC